MQTMGPYLSAGNSPSCPTHPDLPLSAQDKDILPLMDCLASVLPRLKESSAMLGTSAAVLFEKSMQLSALQQELRLASAGGRPVPGGLEYDSSALVCSLDLVGL